MLEIPPYPRDASPHGSVPSAGTAPRALVPAEDRAPWPGAPLTPQPWAQSDQIHAQPRRCVTLPLFVGRT